MADLRKAAQSGSEEPASKSGTRAGSTTTVRVTVDLPEDEHRAFKIASMDRKTPMGELLRAAAEAIAAGEIDDVLDEYVQ